MMLRVLCPTPTGCGNQGGGGADDSGTLQKLRQFFGPRIVVIDLWVPTTSSTLRDQAISVDRGSDGIFFVRGTG